MTLPIILLDCDGVLADFVSGYLALLGSTQDRWHTPEEVTSWDVAESLGLTPEQASAIKRAIGKSDGFARRLSVCPGAVEGVAALREIADVHVVTSPWNSNPTWTHDREWWLKRHFDIPHSHVIHGSAKHLVHGDVFVDDKTDTVIAWRDARGGLAVQWQTPHNRLDEYSGASTCSWADLLAWTEDVSR